jgi:ABC-type branched-subunit amino acid transport system ATPase component/ABC-type branched-subunit amino acid transport system permease subunit
VSLGTLVLGLINGSIVGLLAAGFVLVYKSNRFLNLAHAQLGAVSAMLLAKAVNDWGVNFWVALVPCVALGIVTGLAVERLLVRPVRARTSSTVRLLILSVGIGQVLLGVTYVKQLAPSTNHADGFQGFPQPFTSHFHLGGVVLTGMSVLTLVVVPVLLVALTAFLSLTSVGKQIRAAANNPQAARLCGISVDRVSLITWGIAGGLSAASAVFNGPNNGTSNAAAIGPHLLMLTMGAAAFGAFVSLPWAVGGGLVLGVVYQLVAGQTNNAGLAELWVFLVILIVVLVRGRAIERVFAVFGSAVPEQPVVRVPAVLRDLPLVRHHRWWLGGGGLLLAAAFPRLPYFRVEANQFLLLLVLVYAMVAVSLTLLIGWGGQVSLGHFAVVGLGAYLTARWSPHWSLLGIVLVVGLLGAVASALVGLPAVRVRGLTLVVTTLGFAVLAPQWLYRQRWVGGATPFTTPVVRPHIGPGLGMADSTLKVYYLALAVLVLIIGCASSLRRSNAGRVLLAVRDNERAASSFGVTPATVKLGLLAFSGFVAGVAGVFWAVAWQRVTPLQLTPDTSVAVLALPVIGGLGSVPGALLAAVVLYMPNFFLSAHLSAIFGDVGRTVAFQLILGGMGVVLTMRQFPNGLAGQAAEGWQRYLNRRAAREEAEPRSATEVPALEVRDVAVHFGGVRALAGADITVRAGEIVGLIGQNGAGKTTLMNVISGLIPADTGSVRLFGREMIDLPPDVRSSFGMARSFQDASLFAGLTVTETVQLALSHTSKTGMLAALLSAPWVRAYDRESRGRAEEIVASFGLELWADSLTSELSTGTRRICDLAAQVATGARLVLLDEPTAGVAQREAEAFGPLVRRIREQMDCSILIIEHDMPLLMGLCDRVYAMEAGSVIAEGTAQEVRNDPRVIASYLGTESAAIDRSNGAPPKAVKPRRRKTESETLT